MAKALSPIKHNDNYFAAGEEVTGLSEEEAQALRESGALEIEGLDADGEVDDEEVEEEDV